MEIKEGIEKLRLLFRGVEKLVTNPEYSALAGLLQHPTKILSALSELSVLFSTYSDVDINAIEQCFLATFQKVVAVLYKIAHLQFDVSLGIVSKDALAQLQNMLVETVAIPNGAPRTVPKLDLDLLCECRPGLLAHLRMIKYIVSQMPMLLKYFNDAFTACQDQKSFISQEFSKVSSQLLGVILLLESKSTTKPVKNEFLTIFIDVLDFPLKITLNALRLLFLLPVLDINFGQVFQTCLEAAAIFIAATNMISGLIRIFLVNVTEPLVNDVFQAIFVAQESCHHITVQSPSTALKSQSVRPSDSHGKSKETAAPKSEPNKSNQPLEIQGASPQKSGDNFTPPIETCDFGSTTDIASPIIQPAPVKRPPEEDQVPTDDCEPGVKSQVFKSEPRFTHADKPMDSLPNQSVQCDKPIVEENNLQVRNDTIHSKEGFIQQVHNGCPDNLVNNFSIPEDGSIEQKSWDNIQGMQCFPPCVSADSASTLTRINSSEWEPNQGLIPSRSLLKDISDIELTLLSPGHRQLLVSLMHELKERVHVLSFAVSNSELSILCKICGLTLNAASVTKHEDTAFHKSNASTYDKENSVTCTLVPEILELNWNFLNRNKISKVYSCTLCPVLLSSSSRSWEQHFGSFLHWKKVNEWHSWLKSLNFWDKSLLAVSKQLEDSQKQRIADLAHELKDEMNIFSVGESHGLFFFCNACKRHVASKAVSWHVDSHEHLSQSVQLVHNYMANNDMKQASNPRNQQEPTICSESASTIEQRSFAVDPQVVEHHQRF